MRIPSMRFWAMTLLLTSAGIQILCDCHILTEEDCYREMDDCANGNCYRYDLRDWWVQKKEVFGW